MAGSIAEACKRSTMNMPGKQDTKAIFNACRGFYAIEHISGVTALTKISVGKVC
jgi:hypothetical protein